MRYMKDIPRRAKNGFRSGTTPKPKDRKTNWLILLHVWGILHSVSFKLSSTTLSYYVYNLFNKSYRMINSWGYLNG